MESAKGMTEGGKSVRIIDEYTYKDLESITDGFSAENFMGKTQFGKLFRGKVQQGDETEDVIVKTSTVKPVGKGNYILESQLSRLENEKKLLTHQKFSRHQNLAKLIGYCAENELLGTVYMLKPLDTLDNLFLQDRFKWADRIKVAIQLARLLEFLYDRQIKIHNVDARHIVVDQAFNPKLLDFGRIAGGVFGNTPPEFPGLAPWHCSDPHFIMTGDDSRCDLYAYGLVLLALISKRAVLNREEVGDKMRIRAWAKYKMREGEDKSLVHESLKTDPLYTTFDGVEITKLAMWCVEVYANKRPTIHEIVSCLKGLNLVQRCRLLDIPLVVEDDY